MASKKPVNPLELLARLPSTQNYDKSDRYHDFRNVFSSPEGQRVFSEILSWGHIFATPIASSPIDPYATHVALGEKNIALRLLSTYNYEPPIQPKRQRSTNA